MIHHDDGAFRHLLRAALPPIGDRTLERDLWPRLLRRVEQPALHPSRLDWALAAFVLVWLLAFPETVPGLLYHL